MLMVVQLCVFFWGGDVRLLALRPLLAYCASLGWQWRWLWRSRWNVDWQGKLKFSEKTCPSATFVHHKIPHDQIRLWTRAAAVGTRRLTVWAMARPQLFLPWSLIRVLVWLCNVMGVATYLSQWCRRLLNLKTEYNNMLQKVKFSVLSSASDHEKILVYRRWGKMTCFLNLDTKWMWVLRFTLRSLYL
jgi:hypothetical protein